MSGKKKVLLLIILILFAVFAAIAVWQWNNISALVLFLNNDTEQLEQKLEEEDEEIQESLDKIVQETEPEENKEPEKGQTNNNNSGYRKSENYSEQKARINELINEVYRLRDFYTSQLDSMHKTAMHSFWALPSEQITMDVKRDVAYEYIDRAVDMERQCDAKMTSILEELKSLLTEIGGDTSMVSDISYLYAKEKQIKKAQLMNILSLDPQRNS